MKANEGLAKHDQFNLCLFDTVYNAYFLFRLCMMF